jgi:hypothetical protein
MSDEDLVLYCPIHGQTRAIRLSKADEPPEVKHLICLRCVAEAMAYPFERKKGKGSGL